MNKAVLVRDFTEQASEGAEQRVAGRSPNESRIVVPSSSPAPILQRRGERVKAGVLLAALEIFGDFGFEGATTRAVAKRAGVTHTLVLYHFQSKERLWFATIENALSSYTTEMSANLAVSHLRPAADALKTYIEGFVRMSARWPQIHRIMAMEGNKETERLQWVIENYLRDHFKIVKDLIRRGQDEGSVRNCDAARLYYHIIGAGGTPYTIATEYQQLTGRDVFSEAEIYRNIAFIFEIVFV